MTDGIARTPGGTATWPSVSVVVPVRDDAARLPAAVASALDQDYPGPLEVLVGVGPSRDGTEEVAAGLAAADSRVRVVENTAGTIPAALNATIAVAVGDIVARLDAHAAFHAGYLRRAVEALDETGADNVGGIQRAEGDTSFGRAVAAAMGSRFGVGDARFHYGGRPGPVDTVYLGVFRRDALRRVGGYDETLLRNEDYELNWRLRATGGTVWLDPELVARYAPRATWARLTRQYLDYGRWKHEVLRRHPRSLRWRQIVPPLTLVANISGLLTGLLVDRRALVVPAAYVAVTLAASAVADVSERRARLWLPLVFATMHHAWGLGFVVGGAVRGPDVSGG